MFLVWSVFWIFRGEGEGDIYLAVGGGVDLRGLV